MVRIARASDRSQLATMRAALWPDQSGDEHGKEVDQALRAGMSGTMPAAILVAEAENGALVGFLEVDLRSHADGCDPAQPVGFVEGWFVRDEFRKRGIGRQLMRAAEEWSRQHGCREMASDTWIDHQVSQQAHQALGFEIVDRCVHFRKLL